ncbi:MAG: hypothetical protein KJZ58_03260 [Flavobacteriales bacterium]|nr:hypothetical protein [Flavobacteriales bacterium]
MRFNHWHEQRTWRGRSAFLGRWALLLAFATWKVWYEGVFHPLATQGHRFAIYGQAMESTGPAGPPSP